jgi:hypothetical protein
MTDRRIKSEEYIIVELQLLKHFALDIKRWFTNCSTQNSYHSKVSEDLHTDYRVQNPIDSGTPLATLWSKLKVSLRIMGRVIAIGYICVGFFLYKNTRICLIIYFKDQN